MEPRRSKLVKSSYSQSSLSNQRLRSSLSPYQKLTSNINLKSMMLPSFLHSSKTPILHPSSAKNSIIKPETDEDIIKFVNASRPPICKLLTIGKFELKQDDLKSVLNGNVTTITVDALLTVFKHLNSIGHKRNEGFKKVLIAKTKFTQKLFESDQVECGKAGLDCELMIFPVFVGYWTLLTFSVVDMVVTYYDPLNSCAYLKEILKNFYRYLQRVMRKVEVKTSKTMKEITYQKIYTNDGLVEEDTAVYMLHTIQMLSISQDTEFNKTEIHQYRQNLLKLLIKYGKL